MKGFLSLLLLALCSFTAAQVLTDIACSPTCAPDQICNTDICKCDLALYTATAAPPTPAVDCTGGSMNLYISICQLEKSEYNSSTLHLTGTEAGCTRAVQNLNDKAQVTFSAPLSTGACGNTVVVNGSHVVYSNKLNVESQVLQYSSFSIIPKNDVSMSVSCAFPLNMSVALNVSLNPLISVTQLTVPEVEEVFTVTMEAYRNPDFTDPITADASPPLTVEQEVYISVVIPALEANTYAVKVINIFATPTSDPSSPERFLLVEGGCPILNLVSVVGNGLTNEARFSMRVFQISGYSSVFLHADVKMCEGTCPTTCSVVS
ncbi:pancreatic secretory granule membrane major glycoprotein GP2-like isoform X1 [Ascaphus truei]|uniref:pancreatic secretory granule membrane major glycoprotein GP2-like isoform X1 n=1 Tax=Ascaphus truei TaxID=8439 RepID=UPI003F59356E